MYATNGAIKVTIQLTEPALERLKMMAGDDKNSQESTILIAIDTLATMYQAYHEAQNEESLKDVLLENVKLAVRGIRWHFKFYSRS